LFALNNIFLSALISSILVIAGLYAWKWSRAHYRFLISALTTFLGFVAWNILQSSTGADLSLNIDWPIFPLSWSDVGSGVAAFVATVITLGLIVDRRDLAWRILAASGIAGLLAMLVDLFVL
jgi:hypothetical protein